MSTIKSKCRGLLTIKWIWNTCNHLLAFHLWRTSVWLQSIFSKKELPLAFFGVSQFRLPLPQRTPIEYLCFLSGLLFCNLQVFGCWEFPHQVWVFFPSFFSLGVPLCIFSAKNIVKQASQWWRVMCREMRTIIHQYYWLQVLDFMKWTQTQMLLHTLTTSILSS